MFSEEYFEFVIFASQLYKVSHIRNPNKIGRSKRIFDDQCGKGCIAIELHTDMLHTASAPLKDKNDESIKRGDYVERKGRTEPPVLRRNLLG